MQHINEVMENIVKRATIYDRHIPLKNFFTDLSGKIEYTLNSLWHRDDELKTYSDYTLAVGCSHTFGIGAETPWPKLIDNCYNAGIPGATVHDMCDVAMAIYKDNPYKRVLMFAPHGERFLVSDKTTDGKPITLALMPNSTWPDATKYDVLDTTTKMLYTNRSIESFKYFCKVNDIEYQIVCYTSMRFLRKYKHMILDQGTDGVHYGDKTQENFAGLFNVTQPKNRI